MPRGKKLTVSQMKLLTYYGIDDPNNWLYLKTITEDSDGNDHASKSSDKTISMLIMNKLTSDTKVIPIN